MFNWPKLYCITGASLSMLCLSGLSHGALEEIVVTATKRAESLQDVPISVLATSGEKIQQLGLTNASDVTAYMPAITITENPIGNFIFIRGVGTAGANQGIEQSVSMFHDGIYMGRHQLSRAPFMDLERVEVLRGPQSILFGKNTIGGAVNVIAAKPTQETTGQIAGRYGSEGEVEISGHVSGSLSDSVRGRLSARSFQHDGYLKNVITDQDGPNRDDWTIRAQLEMDASKNLTISAKWETSEFTSKQQSTQLSVINPFNIGAATTSGLNQALVAAATGGSGVVVYDDERAVDNDGGALLGQVLPIFAGLPGFPNQAEGSENNMSVGSITFDLQIEDHTLTAITGYAEYDYVDICDCDFAALPLIEADAMEDYSQFSQEIRIASPDDDAFSYIVGAFYQESDLAFRSGETFGTALAFGQVGVPTPLLVPNLTRDYGMNQKTDQWAVFGSGTYKLSDRTRLTAGLRYFDESKTADHFLNKRFSGGWDYSALLGLPAGSIAFGETAADYDAFLGSFGQADIGGGITPGFLTEAVFGGLLGTFEHDIRDRERSEDAITWSLNLEHDFSDDVMGYAGVSTGVKGGGFDARFLRTNDSPFFEYEEEDAISYEAGLKSTLLDGAMRLNAAVFFSTIEDYQVSIFDGATAFFVKNAAEVESKGIELDVEWAITDKLIVNLAGSLLDAAYKNFPNAPCFASSVSPNRGNCIGFGTPTAFRDASGDTNLFSPELAFNLNFDYRQPVSNNLEGRASVNVNHSGEYFISGDLDPIYGFQDAYTSLDVRLAISDIDGVWEFAIIGKNLTDEFISGNSNDQPLVAGNGFAQATRLRSIAAQVIFNW